MTVGDESPTPIRNYDGKNKCKGARKKNFGYYEHLNGVKAVPYRQSLLYII